MLENFLCDSRGCDPTNRFTSRRSSTALPVAGSKLGIVSVVGVRGTILLRHLGVSLGAMVLVANKDRDGGTKGLAPKGPRENLALIRFVPRCRHLGLAGAPAVEFDLNVSFRQGNEWRTSVDDDADSAPVGLTEG